MTPATATGTYPAHALRAAKKAAAAVLAVLRLAPPRAIFTPGHDPLTIATPAGRELDAATLSPCWRAAERTGSHSSPLSTSRQSMAAPFNRPSADGSFHVLGHRIGLHCGIICVYFTPGLPALLASIHIHNSSECLAA